MATVMEVDQLNALLTKAAAGGCSLAWIEDGTLLTGSSFGRAVYAIDFAHEKLARINTAQDGREASGAAGDENPRPVSEVRNAPAPRLDVPGVEGRRTGNFSLLLEGKLVPAQSQRALLLVALQEIERARPGTLEKVSAEKGRTKRPVARRRELLYEDPKLSRYAEQIEGNWWVATNNNAWEVQKVIRRAAFHAGLHVDIGGML